MERQSFDQLHKCAVERARQARVCLLAALEHVTELEKELAHYESLYYSLVPKEGGKKS